MNRRLQSLLARFRPADTESLLGDVAAAVAKLKAHADSVRIKACKADLVAYQAEREAAAHVADAARADRVAELIAELLP